MKKVLSNPFVVVPNFVMVSTDVIAKRKLMNNLVQSLLKVNKTICH
jgi:hypothetical protein